MGYDDILGRYLDVIIRVTYFIFYCVDDAVVQARVLLAKSLRNTAVRLGFSLVERASGFCFFYPIGIISSIVRENGIIYGFELIGRCASLEPTLMALALRVVIKLMQVHLLTYFLS